MNTFALVRKFSIQVADNVDVEDENEGTLRTLVAEDFRHAEKEEPQWHKYFAPWTSTSSKWASSKILHGHDVQC